MIITQLFSYQRTDDVELLPNRRGDRETAAAAATVQVGYYGLDEGPADWFMRKGKKAT